MMNGWPAFRMPALADAISCNHWRAKAQIQKVLESWASKG